MFSQWDSAQKKPKPKSSNLHHRNHTPRKSTACQRQSTMRLQVCSGLALEYLWCGEKQRMKPTPMVAVRRPLLDQRVNQVEEAINGYVQEAKRPPSHNGYSASRRHLKFNKNTKESEPPCLSLIDTEILDNQMHLHLLFPQLGRIWRFAS